MTPAFPFHQETIVLGQRRLGLCVPDAAIVRTAYAEGRLPFPYWSKVWPAAIGMSEFLLRNAALIENKTVLELGAGLGLPSLAIAPLAASVLCTDAVPEAVEAVRQSAAANGLANVEGAVMDWQRLPNDVHADVLLLSDVNYEPEAFAHLQKAIERFLAEGTFVVLSTPQRLMAKEFVSALLPHCQRQEETTVNEGGGTVAVTVFVLKKDGSDSGRIPWSPL